LVPIDNVIVSYPLDEMMEDRFVRISDELLARMWSKIDLQEFTEVVLSKNYSLYSIDNWSRTNEPI